jgi:hypothetical protein
MAGIGFKEPLGLPRLPIQHARRTVIACYLRHPPAGLGSDTGTQVQALLQGVMTQSKPITLQAWQHRTFDERLREWRARLWQYWM